MANSDQNLGRIVNVFGVQAAYLQRAVFVVILSFVFFLGMMFAFYYLQNFVYFLLASAFLLVYIVTLSSWLMQRRLTTLTRCRPLSSVMRRPLPTATSSPARSWTGWPRPRHC